MRAFIGVFQRFHRLFMKICYIRNLLPVQYAVMKTLLYNAALILKDRVVDDGSVLMEDGFILAICPESPQADTEHDCEGRMLMPGFVDLHSDVIEKDFELRRGVFVPECLAVREADKRCAQSGITTQFHGISFGHAERGLRDDAMAFRLAQAVVHNDPELLIDNRVLARYEIASFAAMLSLERLIDEQICSIVSFMDHSPDSMFYDQALQAFLGNGSDTGHAVLERMHQLAGRALAAGVALGSHDDDSTDRIKLLASFGIGMSEFPKTRAVAEAACELGVRTIVGGPNAVRGGSHLKWLSAAEAVSLGIAACVCSDYHPTILPQALVRLAVSDIAPLHEIVRLFTLHPAQAAGLHDRGSIAPGLRADLLEMGVDGAGWARVCSTWSMGQQVSRMPMQNLGKSAHSQNPYRKDTFANTRVIMN